MPTGEAHPQIWKILHPARYLTRQHVEAPEVLPLTAENRAKSPHYINFPGKNANPVRATGLIEADTRTGKVGAKEEDLPDSTGRIRDRTPPWLRTSELESQNTLDSLHHRRYFSDPTSTFLCSSAGRAGGC